MLLRDQACPALDNLGDIFLMDASRLDLEEEIPPEVYKAVAEILAFIYRLSNRPMETSGSRQNILPGQATSRH